MLSNRPVNGNIFTHSQNGTTKIPAQSPLLGLSLGQTRRTTLGGRSVAHGFSRDMTRRRASAHLYAARIASPPRRRSRTPLPLRRIRRTASEGRSFSSDVNVARSAYLHVARIASLPRRRSRTPLPSRRIRRTASEGRSFSSDVNVARSAYLHVARIASPLRRRSRMPLPLLLPLSLPHPHAPFLIDNFRKSRAIRNHVQLTQNKRHHRFLIDNFYGPRFPFPSPPVTRAPSGTPTERVRVAL